MVCRRAVQAILAALLAAACGGPSPAPDPAAEPVRGDRPDVAGRQALDRDGGPPGHAAGEPRLVGPEQALADPGMDPVAADERVRADALAPRETHRDPGAVLVQPLHPRPYAGAPPVVPHGIGDFLPLTNSENNCLLCHQPGGEKVEGEPTPLPASHLEDLRRAPGVQGEEVAGARHNCLACHVAAADVAPLVENAFTSPGSAPPGS